MAAPTITGSRKDTFRITLTVAGKDWGVWEQKTGGKTSANTSKIWPGSMQKEKSLGGRPTTDTITLTRNFDRVRDQPRMSDLYAAIGQAVCVVKEQPLDAEGRAYGKPTVWNGTLDAITPVETDSSSTDSATYSVDITPVGTPSN